MGESGNCKSSIHVQCKMCYGLKMAFYQWVFFTVENLKKRYPYKILIGKRGVISIVNVLIYICLLLSLTLHLGEKW